MCSFTVYFSVNYSNAVLLFYQTIAIDITAYLIKLILILIAQLANLKQSCLVT